MEGGSYRRKSGEDAKRVGGTIHHEKGDRARDADGAALNGRSPPQPATAAPIQPAAPAVAPVKAGAPRPANKSE